jgi:hypothetical protein
LFAKLSYIQQRLGDLDLLDRWTLAIAWLAQSPDMKSEKTFELFEMLDSSFNNTWKDLGKGGVQ